MKSFVLSSIAILAMSTYATAGGSTVPVEASVAEVEPVAPDAGFYIGAGYGWQGVELYDDLHPNAGMLDANYGSIMIDAGYKFNSYIAAEARYWFGLSSSDPLAWKNDISSDITIDSWAIFLKPMFPISEAFNIYALLGYGATDLSIDLPAGTSISTDSADAFTWGVGAEYGFTENISMFIDYTQMLNNEDIAADDNDVIDISLDNVNIGVNYKF